MLRDFLTPEAFEIGIIRYLKRYSYQNTVNNHLWESLTRVSVCVSIRKWSGRGGLQRMENCAKKGK